MQPIASSYRDPSGFIFEDGGKFYRYIAPPYFDDYTMLMESGLYKALSEANRLVKHEEIKDSGRFGQMPDPRGKIILPEQIPFISYPYEWSFDMWRDAAIVTLKIASASLEKAMMLKDATPYNIQFFKGRPVFIDTLSFEEYKEGSPWIAYRQFCECFLGPLLLMHYGHRDAAKLFLSYPDGIPLDMIRSLLPKKAKWNIHVYLNIFVQAKIAAGQKGSGEQHKPLVKSKLELLLKGLTGFIEKLKPRSSASEWDNYYAETILGKEYLESKTAIIKKLTDDLSFRTMIDLGANDGFFSLLLKDRAELIIATDGDSNCINALYREIRKQKIKNILPLVSMLNNPSPATGWANAERESLTQRLQGDLVLALALVHHLAISANLPLARIAKRFADMCTLLIIEFVPRTDEKVQLLLKDRRDDFPGYDEGHFKAAFDEYFNVVKEEKAGSSGRIIFLMKKK